MVRKLAIALGLTITVGAGSTIEGPITITFDGLEVFSVPKGVKIAPTEDSQIFWTPNPDTTIMVPKGQLEPKQ